MTKKEQEKIENIPELPKPPKSRYFFLGLSLTCFAGGLGLGYLYWTTLNIAFGYAFLIPIGLGYWFWRMWRREAEQAEDVIYTGKPIPKKRTNCMNIYPADKGGIVFEDMPKPEGQPKICVNDGKPYFIHIWDEAKNKLVPFGLPDQTYYDPRVFAERVLSLPAHRALFMKKESLLQKLSPFILLLVLIVEWLIFITTTSGS